MQRKEGLINLNTYKDDIGAIGSDVVPLLGDLENAYRTGVTDHSYIARIVHNEREAHKQYSSFSQAALLPDSLESVCVSFQEHGMKGVHIGELIECIAQPLFFETQRPVLCAPGVDLNGRYFYPLQGVLFGRRAPVIIVAQFDEIDRWSQCENVYGVVSLGKNEASLEIDYDYVSQKMKKELLVRYGYVFLERRMR